MLPGTESSTDLPDPSPDTDHLFDVFRAARSSQEMLALAAATSDDALDALQTVVDSRLAAAEGDETIALRERLESLRTLRGEHADDIRQMRELASQLAEMPEEQRLLLAFTSAASTAEIIRLVAGTSDDDLGSLEATAATMLAGATGDAQDALERRLVDLRRWRAAEADARRILTPLGDEASQALADRLVVWIQMSDWDASQAFLQEHAAELLTDAGAAAMTLLRVNNAGHDRIELHGNLLAACREHGMDAAYTQLRQEMDAAEQLQNNPLLQAVIAFLQADEPAAREQLADLTSSLLTADARNLIEQFLAGARQAGDAHAEGLIAGRLALWQEVWRTRAGGPLHRSPAAEERQPERWDAVEQNWQRQPEAGERAAKYHNITAINSIVGENNTVFKITNVGEVSLRWQQPRERWKKRIHSAVGREQELADLHKRLTGGNVALVSRGTSAAVRGQPGIGKSVLADMYVERYGNLYQGGVFWLDFGPSVRRAFHVTPELQRMAAFAYEDLAQATKLLEGCELSSEIVAALLGRHGSLLVVADDLWSEEALAALKAALPEECSLLLTTRDYDVAFSLDEREDVIQQLDVMSKEDARKLLQSKVSGLETNLADRLAHGLGRHAQALTLAAGALLARRKVQTDTKTIDDILQRVATGRGFGDLPRLDKTERLNKVEIALKYSYDFLGEAVDGYIRQAWLRGLGVFAQEADFAADAAAAVWGLETENALEALLLLDGLALIQATDNVDRASGGRWQQHAILRAYALSLLDEEERLDLPQRHADHYLALAHASIPTATERVEQEFKQIEHAFEWCQRHSPARATALANIVSQVMFIRGRATQAGEWLRISMDAANQTGNRSGKANTLQSLGDLESRLGNLDQARRHYDAALPLYEAEQARLGKANTLKSLGDLESRLGNLDQARRHYDAALPLYEAEQARLGKANTLKSLGDLESRLGNLDQARRHYDAALPLYEAEQDRLGKANTLKSLGDLERRLGNLDQARRHYDAALPLYEAEQARLGKANTLQSLGDLESRLGNLDQARRHYDAALPLYEAEQARLGKANTLQSLGDLESRLGNLDQARRHYDAALPLYEAEQARLGKANTLQSLGDLESRLGNLDQARRHYDAALPLYEAEQEPGGIINTLVARARLEVVAGNVEQAVPLYEQAFSLADQTSFANHPVVQEMRREYEGVRGLANIQNDPLAAALSALLRADSDAALAQALTEYPILAETDTLLALADLINQALAAHQNETVARLTVLWVTLMDVYNHAHTEQIAVESHQAVIDLCEQVIPLAEQINGELAAALRQQAGWACNTLGNHFASDGENQDLGQAVAAYSRGLGFNSTDAMLLRNRAGVYLDRRDPTVAQADIEAAAALEPDAPRLAELRDQLAQLQQPSPGDVR